MFYAHLSVLRTKLAIKLATTKKALLLSLLTVIAVAGVVFSGSSVHSSDSFDAATQPGESAQASAPGESAERRAQVAQTGQVLAQQGRAGSSGNFLPLNIGNQLATARSAERPQLSHSPALKFFPALAVGPITASMTDALVNDDGDSKIDPTDGTANTEKITYTATITNTGTDPATHVKFTVPLKSNVTLVPGSINTSPVAGVDTYSASGNIPISLNAAGGVLSNDFDPDNGSNSGLTVTEVQGAGANVGVATNTTATGRGGVKGSVNMAANGSFSYEPPPGFEGADTFTYKVSDGTASDTATVTINISGMCWFIQNNGAGANRGTFSDPFTTIAAFDTANAASGSMPDPKNGDFIALRTGTGTYNETDGVNLRSQQKLIGNAIQFNTVFTAATNSSSAYTTFAGAAGSAPNIVTSGGGDGVDLALDNVVRGLNIGNTPGAFKISGSTVGSPVFNTINLTGTGGAINVSTSGAFGSNVTFATLESTSSPTSNINLVSVTGTLGVTSGGTGLSGSANSASASAITINGGSVSLSYPGNITKANTGSLLNVSNSHSGTLTFTGTLSATSGDGLQFSNADGTYNFNGTTTLNGGDAGIDILSGSGGTFSFNSNTSITASANEAIKIDASSAGVTYSGSFSKSNGTRGILISNNTGGTILFNGSGVTKSITTSGAANAIELASNPGTTINFTNNNLLLNASGTGIALSATGGGTLTVQGTGNTLTAATNATVGTGAALNMVNTNIGLAGLTFQSINVNGASSAIVLNNVGTTSGTNGGLSVTGTGSTAGSGGTIQNNVQGAIITQTRDLSLKNMNFTNANSGNGTCQNVDNSSFNSACQAAINMNTVTNATFDNLNMSGGAQVGINGRTVSNLSLTNSTVANFGGGAAANQGVNENDVRLFNLTGTCTITNTDFSFAAGDTTAGESLVDIRNDTGTLTLNVDGDPSNVDFNNFTNTRDSDVGNYGLTVTAVSSATVTMTVRRSKFTNIKTAGVATFARGSAIMNVNITGGGVDANGNTFDPTGSNTGRAIDLNAQNTAQLNFNINDNTKIYGAGGPVINIFSIGTATVKGRINSNPDIRGGGNGIKGSPIFVHPEDSSTGFVEVLNNTISNVGNDPGIYGSATGGNGLFNASLDFTVKNNNISMVGSNTFGIEFSSGASNSDTTKLYGDVQNNAVTVGGSGNVAFGILNAGGASAFVYLEGFTTNGQTTWNNRGNTPLNSYAEAINVNNPQAIPAGHNGGHVILPSNPSASLNLDDMPGVVPTYAQAVSPFVSNTLELWTGLALASNAPAPSVPQSASLSEMLAWQSRRDVTTLFNEQVYAPSSSDSTLKGVATASILPTSADTATAEPAALKAETTAIADTGVAATGTTPRVEANDAIASASANVEQVAANAPRPVSKNRGEMVLSHAVRTRVRPSALAAALVSGETVTIDGGAGVSPANSGFTLPGGKSITVTFQVTLDNPPNVDYPWPTGGPQIKHQGTVTADGPISVVTDDPTPPAPLPNGSTDQTVTYVDLFNSQTAVASDNTPSNQNDSVTFTATVSLNPAGSPAGTPPTPTQTVDFFDGTATPGNEISGCTGKTLDGTGKATCTTSTLPPGVHTITVRYNGDGNYETSTGTTSQTVIACATNPVVTSTADSGPNTLREAITTICSAPNNNVTFNLGAGPHTITALSTLVIAKNVNITNTLSGTNGAVTIDANGGNFNVFRVDSPVTSASISGLTVTGANATSVSGGGILVQSGTVTLTGMLFTGNTVINGDGGAIAAGSSTTVNVRNSTISGNTAREGGGLVSTGGTINLLNVTITNNNANGNTGTGACPAAGSINGGGGGIKTNFNPTDVKNTILSFNTACSAAKNASGAFTSESNNIFDIDPGLAALADNGGLTRTHALLSNSPALDAGDNTAVDAVPLTTDQRGTGFGRKRDAADVDTTQTTDIGAFEADPSVQDISNKTTAEDTPLEVIFNVGDSATAFDSITASSSNTTLLPNANAVVSADTASTRKLTLTPATNETGTTTITVTVTKTISGTPVSMSDTFDLTVTEVNDAPTANPDMLTAVNEDSGLRTIPFTDLTTNDSRGPANENGQTLTVTAVNNPIGGTVQINGTNVEFTPTADFAGAASFDYTVQDNGTTNGADDFKSANGSASFTVTAINDEPSFTKGADETVAEDAGAQTVNPWATGISRGGGADENSQTLTFNVTNNTNTALFSVQPAVSDTGVLTYTPAANAFGTAAITLELKDNGGTAGGGDDTSPTQTFNITVTPVADTPSVTNASTTVNVQTTSGLVLDHNAADSGEVTHFKITNIQNGTLYQNGGAVQINDGDFITYAEGNAGLRFTPTTDSTATGSFDVQAATDGTGSGLSGTATATITVTKNGTSTDLASSNNPSYDNQTVTFTATVTSNTSLTGPPTGTVTFKEGINVICNTVTLDGTGKATCQTNTLTSAGSPYTITAEYNGDAAFDTSVSSGLTQTVLPNLSLTVNMTSDAADANVGDGVCDTDLGTAGDQCTLRAAIQETNSVASDDIINFNIPTSDPGYDSGTGVYTITLLTALPEIDGNVQINGLGSGVLTVKRSTAMATPEFRIFSVNSGKTVMIFGMTITNGKVSGVGQAGGGIENVGDLTLDDMVITGNNAPSGGGIDNFSGGTLIAGEITVSNNTTTFAGGGIINVGTMSLTESTISGNTAGATANAGGIFSNGALTITNTTFSGNSAGENGGGIHLEAGSLTAVNVTITNNRADSDNNGSGTGGGISRSTGTIILHNTIVAGNFNENGAVDAADDVSGALDASGVNNLIGDGTGMTGLTNGSNGNQVGTLASPIDPRLGPLANNGGLTLTHALLPGSPALDAGSDTEANNAVLITDQRCSIHNRYVDSDDADTTPTVDIGAFEAQVSVQDIADQATNEDTQLQFNFNVSDGLSSSDVTATSSDTAIVPNANISATGASSPLTLTINPAANQFGTVTITVTVTSSGHTMTDTFQLTVNSVNDVPSFTKGADQTVGEDAGAQSVSGWATSISAGPANESTQTVAFVVTGNTNTALFSTQPAVSSTGTLTYTPANNANGTAKITLIIQDSGGTANGGVDTSSSQSFDINVTAVNDVPTADAQSVTTAEDTPKAITLSGSDVETPSGSLTFSIDTGPTNGMLSGSGANRTYTPNPGYNGPDSFTFKVNDGTTDSAPATVTINVTEVNDAPTAVNDTISDVAEDSAQRSIPFADLTGNDSKGPANENGQTLTVNNVSNPVGGTVSISGSNVLFTPTANYNGPASFQYTVLDNGTTNGAADPLQSPTAATVSFQITATADTPSVTNATTNEDTQTTSGLVITRNAVDGAEVTHFKITGITGGTLFKHDGVTVIGNGQFITVAEAANVGGFGLKFTPAADSNTNGSFTVQASVSGTDAGLGGGTVTATITVNNVNDAPTLDAIGDLTINEDDPQQTVNLSGITPGPFETQTLTVTATSNNTGLIPNPAVNYTSPNATGTLTFTPVANQTGSALITVTVNDGGGTANGGVETVVRTFTVTVNAVNDAPVNTVPGAQGTDADTPLTFSAAKSNLISISDVDAGAATVRVTLSATNGTLTLSSTAGLAFTVGDGTADATMTFTGTIAAINAALNGMVFTPTSGFNGAASVQITTNDQGNTGAGGALSDTDTVNITVDKRSFKFSLDAYTVGEAEGHALITVTRTGGTGGTASVDYATSDMAGLNLCSVNTGDASARCDYTAIGGTLIFMPGESSKTFTVPVINDVYVEGPEVLTLTLSNVVGDIALGSPAQATLTITDNDNTPGAFNPIDTREFLIRQLYLDTLNREPEPAGLAGWLNRLNTCPPPGETLQNCDEIEVASAFFRSPEFFDRAFFLYKFYEASLGRQPQYDEYQHDLLRMTGFLTTEELELRKQQFVEEFVNRPEFHSIYDSFANGQPFVDAVLARAGSARPGVGAATVTTSNRVSVINRLGAGQITRAQAVRELMEAPEISQRFFNKAFVVVGYFAFLRRNPDAAYIHWINMLNNTGDYREMIRGFLQSPEFRLRFGQM